MAHDVEVTFVGSWFDHPLFIAANAAHVREALAEAAGASARVARDSCSPRTAFRSPMASRVAISRHSFASRRGSSPTRPACATGRSSIRAAAAGPAIRGSSRMSATTCDANGPRACAAAVLCPIGFVCDHIEVLYDLDREAADCVSRRSGCRWRARRRSTTIRCFST